MLCLMHLYALTPHTMPVGFLQSEGGEWPLYVAARHGHLDVMQKLEEVLLLLASVS